MNASLCKRSHVWGNVKESSGLNEAAVSAEMRLAAVTF